MKQRFGLNRFVIWLLGRIFILIVKPSMLPQDLGDYELSPPTGEQTDLNKGRTPVLYAIQDNSLADLVVLKQISKKCSLPDPTQELLVGTHKEARAFFSLKRWDGLNTRLLMPKKKQKHKPKALERVVGILQQNPALDVKVVPVSIYWGRSPDKERSIWKILFSDAWGAPNPLRKFFMVLIHGRQALVKFNKPISLRQVIKDAHNADQADQTKAPLQQEPIARKVSRVLRVHFRRQREAIIGPDLSHRRTLISSLIRSSAVNSAIQKVAAEENISVEKAELRARKMANEIAADYSHAVIQIYRVVLAWLWTKLYDGINVHNSKQLEQLAQDYEIVYVPCHRSHIDYLLLSYVLYMDALVPPHIAAGINLNLPVLGPVLRRGGAFFMRRSFDNPMYSAIFSEYLNTVLSKGFAIEYFIEGGRSRTGRMLQPRTGMIAMTVRSYLQNKKRPIAFVPVYIGYEKVIEGASYQGELKGKVKQKESLMDLVKSIRQIRRNFGKVSTNFGDPIFLDETLDKAHPNWSQESFSPTDRPEWIVEMVNKLGIEIVTRMNSAAVINPVNLAALVMLSTPKLALDERTLEKQLELYLSLQNEVPYSDFVVNETLSAREIIQYNEAKNLLQRQQHPLGDLIYLPENDAVNLTFFRNTILHLFSLPGLVASCVINEGEISAARIIRFCRLIYPFIQSELFLVWEGKELDKTIRAIITTLVKQGILNRKVGSQLITTPSTTSQKYVQLEILANSTKHTSQRYYITVTLLLKHDKGTLNASELESLCQLMAQRLSTLHEFNAPEFFDKALFRNFIKNLQTSGLIWTDDNDKLHYGPLIEEFSEESWRIMGKDLQLSIRQVTDSKIDLLSLEQKKPATKKSLAGEKIGKKSKA